MADVGSLEQKALERKNRLKQLRELKEGGKKLTDESDSKSQLPAPIFRSYKPADPELSENVLPEAKPESVEEHVKDTIESVDTSVGVVDLTSLAPRKPDWDLKRDVAKKLEKLNRRTKRAIAELIRERLKEQQALAAED